VKKQLILFLRTVLDSVRDLSPIVLVIAFFQMVVLRQPLSHVSELLGGIVMVVLGVFRILKGWPIHYFIMAGYLLVVIMTGFAPREIIGIAYDSGGVTTSTITVPLVTALGIGLASSIHGRNPMVDGFGLIAFASVMPIIFVMVFGVVVSWTH